MVTFIKSASKESEWINDDKIEICFIGRSNVGKSTLLNGIVAMSLCEPRSCCLDLSS